MKRYRFKGTSVYPTIDGSKIEIGDKTIFSVNRNRLVCAGEEFIFKAVTMKEILASSVELTHNTKLYPAIALPCTPNDVARLYTFFNKKLFANECPPVSDVRITSVRGAKSSYADASTRYKSGKFQFQLRFSDKSMVNVEFFCNVVIHEMIHILHQKRFVIDRDPNFDLTVADAHGPIFVEEMNRINSLGYNILKTVSVDNDIKESLQVEKHILIVGGLEVEAAFYSNVPIDVDKVLNQVRSSGFSPAYYYVGTSTDGRISSYAVELSSKQTYSTAVKKLPFKKVDFFKSMVTIDKVESVSVSKELQSSIYRLAHTLEYPWKDYSHNILKYGGLSTALPDSDANVKYIRTTWESMTETDLKRSKILKDVYQSILKEDWNDGYTIETLVYYYFNNFEGRFTPEQYADVCVSKFDIVTISGRDFKKKILERIANKGG